MINQRIATRLVALMLVVPATANADNLPALPVPHITDAPNRITEGPFRTAHFTFSATPQSVSGYGLYYRLQQWFCPPGKDNPPADTGVPVPWAGQDAACTLVNNIGSFYSSSSSTVTSKLFDFPINNAPFRPGTWYVRVKLVWQKSASSSYPSSSAWSAWHRTLVVATPLPPHTARFMGTQGARALRGRASTSVNPNNVTKGTKPPVIAAPIEGAVFHGGPINLSINVSPHTPNTVWSCCQMEWKRARILSPENKAYAQAHTPGHTEFPSTPMPWQLHSLTADFATNLQEVGTSLHGGLFYEELRPHHRTFGYRYLFRLREEYFPNGLQDHANYYMGPYSAWRSFVVQDPVGSPTFFRGMHVQSGATQGKSAGQQQSSHRMTVPLQQMQIRR